MPRRWGIDGRLRDAYALGVAFAGTPFPVTRGDTLFISARPRDAVTGMPTPVAMAAARPRAPPAVASGPRVDGAVALEMYGSHSETVGLGADSIRTTRDIGMPAVRFNTMVSGDRTRFRLSMRAQQRTGPTSVWDRSTRIRIYEARLERSIGAARLTMGRFYSDFDHQSAFWDGASVRFGDGRGVSAGVAAGFEPERGNGDHVHAPQGGGLRRHAAHPRPDGPHHRLRGDADDAEGPDAVARGG